MRREAKASALAPRLREAGTAIHDAPFSGLQRGAVWRSTAVTIFRWPLFSVWPLLKFERNVHKQGANCAQMFVKLEVSADIFFSVVHYINLSDEDEDG